MIPILAAPVVEVTISAEAVAWYGAVVATASAILSGYLAVRDRASLKVTARPNYQVFGEDPTRLYISVDIANKGRRPVSIRSVALVRVAAGKTTRIVPVESLRRGPVELSEGQGTNYLIPQEDLDLSEIKSVVAYDRTGREWEGPFATPSPGS